MNFTRQFSLRPIVERKKVNKKSKTVQGAILSNQKIVDKFLQGNMYGMTFNANVTFDSDSPDYDENHVIAFDRSDRLISLYQLRNKHQYLVKQINDQLAADTAAAQKALETTTV